MERLQKVIAQSGVASRRKSEELIKEGKVKVNGQVITELGTKVTGKDVIEVEGKVLMKEQKEYYLLFKPKNTLCSVSDDRDRTTVVSLIETNQRIFPVGRLDYDTTGLLLLTNDGDFANKIIHPRSKLPKTYIAFVKGMITAPLIKELERGVIIDDYKTQPCKARIMEKDFKNQNCKIKITINEGRNRQVKKMFEAIGLKVSALHRESLAFLVLRDMKPGEYRRLKPHEIKHLLMLADGKNPFQ